MRARAVAVVCGALAAAIPCVPVRAAAQDDLPNRICARETGPGPFGADTMSASAYAESLAVLAQLDRAVRSRPRDGALWYRRAMVAWALASSPPERARAHTLEYTRFRQTADLSFQSATQLNPPVMEHFLMAGKYYLTSVWANTRATGYGYFREALKLARTSGDSAAVARAAIEVARIYWRWYDGFGGSQDGADFLQASALLREAYDADRAGEEAYHYLAMLYADGDRWTELEALARERLSRRPRDGWTWMTVGLARQRMRDSPGARAAFDTGLALLSPAERARLDRFDRLVRPSDSAAFANTSAEERRRIEARSWAHADPLWSEPHEDARVEFLARVTFAELRWTVPERGVRGADTDGGNIYVRYGPPRRETIEGPPDPDGDRGAQFSGADVRGEARASGRDASLGPGINPGRLAPAPKQGSEMPGHSATTWTYPGLMFQFLGMRTFGVSCFDDPERARQLVDATPSRWDNIADVRFDSVLTQVARFRAAHDSVDVFMSAFAPFERIRGVVGVDRPSVRSTLWIQGVNTADSLTTSIAVPFDAEVRWTPRVSAGRYYYRVETTAGGGLFAGRARNTMEMGADPASGFATTGFGISDVLLSDSLTRIGASGRWRDFDVVPVLGGRVRERELSLVWENYEFGRDADLARYRVMIHLAHAPRTAPGAAARIAAQIVGGVANLLGVSRREESDGVTFEFDREVPHRATLVDHVTLGLEDTPPGSYILRIEVTDSVSSRTTARTLPITIVR